MISGSSSSSTIPELAGGQHDKISNGSQLIAINRDAKQGRFLQVCILQAYAAPKLCHNKEPFLWRNVKLKLVYSSFPLKYSSQFCNYEYPEHVNKILSLISFGFKCSGKENANAFEHIIIIFIII